MLFSLAISFFLTGSCPGTAKNLLKMSQIQENSAQRISQAELMKFVRIPTFIDGIVATLYESSDLRIYAITNLEKTGFDEIHIWGFGRFPIPLAVIEAGGHVELMASIAQVSTALKIFPAFKKLFIEKGILPALQTAQEKYHEAESVYIRMDEDLRSGKLARSWDDVYKELYQSRLKDELKYEALHAKKTSRDYVINRLATAPNPPGAEKRTIEFAGWLKAENAPELTMEKVRVEGGYGLKIYLHSRHQSEFDLSFLTIDKRMILENRFELSWLKLSTLKVIELVDPSRSEGGAILVFNGSVKIPRGLSYYLLNPKTGLRISNKVISS
ncbi:MAG: hypothetical protein J0L93_02140 [Deltaproteobacteria bacterium]|nr:hypothetical protein [Deltaproteobacteria bacterium]